jgi:hypothetical protein
MYYTLTFHSLAIGVSNLKVRVTTISLPSQICCPHKVNWHGIISSRSSLERSLDTIQSNPIGWDALNLVRVVGVAREAFHLESMSEVGGGCDVHGILLCSVHPQLHAGVSFVVAATHDVDGGIRHFA